MRKDLVLTLTGRDQIGIVEKVTKLMLNYGGNVTSSRMARLGGEFAMLMLISVPAERFDELRNGINQLQQQGFSVTTCPTEYGEPEKYIGWLPYQVQVHGADHEGIIHHIARHLAKHNINIESMDTDMVKAPMSGTPLFVMSAIVLVPPKLSYHNLQNELEQLGDDLNVDIKFLPYTGK